MVFARIASASSPARSQRTRWIVVLAASALLHALIFSWAGGQLAFPSGGEREPVAVSVVLHQPPPPPRAAPKPRPKPAPKPARKPRPKPAPQAVPVAPAVEPAVSAVPEAGTAAEAQAVDDTPPLAEVMPDLELEQATPRLLWQAVDLPPSAELRYDVYAFKKEQHWYGNGVFHWESNDGRYRLVGEANASLLFFKITVLNFSSEGVINEYGVAPLRYSEKPWRKSATDTLFLHEQQKIDFPASNASHPYHGGEQDRASVIWQLAGIGRAAPERMQPGAELEVVVAGPRDADVWRIQVIGLEEIEAAGEKLRTWHLARVRHGGRGQRIDVWLAPEQNWYPVKVRQSDANGDYLDLTLAELTPVGTAPSNRMEHE